MKKLMTLLLVLMTYAAIAQQFDNNGFEQDPSCPDNCLFANTQMACVPSWDGFPTDGGINFLQKNICTGNVVCVGERSVLLRRTGSIINGISTSNPIPDPDIEGIPEVVSLNAVGFPSSAPGTGVCISGLDTPSSFPTELGCAAPTQLGQCEDIFVILDSDASAFNLLAFTTRPINGGNPGATHQTVVDEISYDGALFEIDNNCDEITFQFNTGGIGSIVEAYLVDIIDPDGNTLCTFEQSPFETLKTCAIDEAGTYEVTVAMLFNNGADPVVFDVNYEVLSAGENCCQAPVPRYIFTDADGNQRTEFCFGEEVFMDGTASTDEDSHFISIWQYNIGGLAAGEDNLAYCRIFPGEPGLVFQDGEVPVRSLSAIWADCFGTPDFEPGFEYRLQLVVTNECFGGWHAKEDEVFTVTCCPENELDPSFRLTNTIFGDDTYTIEAIDYELYEDQNAIHEWFVYTEDPDGSTNPIATIEGPTFSYDLTEYGQEYFVIHRVRTECEERCFRTCISNGGNGNADQSGETGREGSRGGESMITCLGEEVDCDLINGIFSSCDELGAPTNLHVVDGNLVWGPVLGASNYSVTGTIGGLTSCNCGGTVSIDLLIGETMNSSLPIPDFLLDRCFEWTVTAICADGNNAVSEPACYYPSMFQEEVPDRSRVARKKQLDGTISISPNPAKNHVELFNKTSKEVTIEWYQINGQLLWSRAVQAHSTLSIDVASVEAGLYLVLMKDKQNGALIQTEKLIIQK